MRWMKCRSIWPASIKRQTALSLLERAGSSCAMRLKMSGGPNFATKRPAIAFSAYKLRSKVGDDLMRSDALQKLPRDMNDPAVALHMKVRKVSFLSFLDREKLIFPRHASSPVSALPVG